MNPTTPDEPKFNPFDLWKGANFKLKAHLESGYVSYEKSAFQAQSELFDGDDKKLEALWKSQHPLLPFVAADQFKSYEDLSARLGTVLKGGVVEGGAVRAEEAQPEDFRTMSQRLANDVPAAAKKSSAPAKAAKADDDDDALAYFKRLAEDED
jgi:hypothetical protein